MQNILKWWRSEESKEFPSGRPGRVQTGRDYPVHERETPIQADSLDACVNIFDDSVKATV